MQYSRAWLALFVASTLCLGGAGCSPALRSKIAEDIVRNRDPLPPPSPSVNYRDTAQFDLQVYVSLRELDDVRVEFSDPVVELPERVLLWTNAVSDQDGVVVTCDVSDSAGLGGGVIASLAMRLVERVLAQLRRYLLYKPAKKVHAIVEVDGADRQARSVRFIGRQGYAAAKDQYDKCDF